MGAADYSGRPRCKIPCRLASADALALAFFLGVWVLFALAADGRLVRRTSLTQAMNAQREAWMHTMARRELRMIDTGIMAGLQQGTAFFASSALLAIGGCFALLGATDRVLSVLSDLPFFATPARGVFETKTIGLDRAVRLCLLQVRLVVPAVQLLLDPDRCGAGAARRARRIRQEIEIAVRRAARMNILGGKHFNAGLRGVFFSIGYLGWFVGPAVLVLSTLLLVTVLVRRQFFSAARHALLEAASVRLRERARSMRPGQPIAGKADPFAHRHRRVLQRVGGVVAKQPDPFRARRAVVDRPRNHWKADLAEQPDRARHVEAEVTSSQVSPGSRRRDSLENTAFSAVLRDLFSRISRSRGTPSAVRSARRGVGVALAFEQHRADAAGDQDFRFGKAARQHRRFDEAVAAAVQLIAAAHQIDRALEAAAKHDDAVDVSGSVAGRWKRSSTD